MYNTCTILSTHSYTPLAPDTPFPYIDLPSILAMPLRNLILRSTRYFHKRKFPLAHSDRRCQHKTIDRKVNLFYILSEYLNIFVELK